MIASEHLAIFHRDGTSLPIHLAPFSEDELKQYIPFPDEYTRFNPIRTTADAEFIMTAEEREHYLAWGIYAKKPATENFIGTVALSESNAGTVENPVWSTVVQEVHTGIFSQEWHGNNIGTLAKLAVISYAFERQNTHAIYAQTSEHNVAAQKSLAKIGFARLETYEHFSFKDGGLTESWMLADPIAQKKLPNDQAKLAKAWPAYEAAHKAVALEGL